MTSWPGEWKIIAGIQASAAICIQPIGGWSNQYVYGVIPTPWSMAQAWAR